MPVVAMPLVRSSPLCRHRPAPRSLSPPRGSPFQVSLPLLPPSPLRPLAPPAGLNRQPSTLPFPMGLCCVIHFPLSLVHPPRPPCCFVVSWCLLVSCVFVGWPFALQREARAPPLPVDLSPRPSSPRYLDMPLPFRIPDYPLPPVHFPVSTSFS